MTFFLAFLSKEMFLRRLYLLIPRMSFTTPSKSQITFKVELSFVPIFWSLWRF